jgi:hypothetical protein
MSGALPQQRKRKTLREPRDSYSSRFVKKELKSA